MSPSNHTKGVTEDQRYQMCLRKLENPSMTQAELGLWFQAKYGFPVSQPTVSQWLKRSAEILGRGPLLSKYELSRVRRRRVRHPELETAIYQWVLEEQQRQLHVFQQKQQQTQRRQMYLLRRRFRLGNQPQYNDTSDGMSVSTSNVTGSGLGAATRNTISGPELIRQAKRIAQEMGIDDIVFCSGWLARFKSRYGVQIGNRPPSMEEGMDSDAITVPNTASNPMSTTSSLSPSRTGSPILSNVNIDRGGTVGDGQSNLNNMVELIATRPSLAVPSSIDAAHASLQLQQITYGHPIQGHERILSEGEPQQTIQSPYGALEQERHTFTPPYPQPLQQSSLHSSNRLPTTTTISASSGNGLGMHMQFLDTLPLVPIASAASYTIPTHDDARTASVPKHASADIVIPTSDSPLLSCLMLHQEEDETINEMSSRDIESCRGLEREKEQEGEEEEGSQVMDESGVLAACTDTPVMTVQEARLAVKRLRQFAAFHQQQQEPSLVQGMLHSFDVIEQAIGTLLSHQGC